MVLRSRRWAWDDVRRDDAVLAQVWAELGRPGVWLRVMRADGGLFSESNTWADTFQS